MCVKYLVLIGILGAFSAANGLRVTFEDCMEGDKKVNINYAEISPCTEEPCGIYHGDNVTIRVNFDTIVQGPESLNPSIFVVMKNLGKHPFAKVSMPSDACKGAGLTCPMSPGTTHTYVEYVIVPKYVRKGEWTLGLKLTNGDDGEDYLCVAAEVVVKSAATKN